MKVLFIDGTAGFTPYRIKEKPTGGIITSLTLLPRYLAKKGVKVVVASEYKGDTLDGVEYTNIIRDEDKQCDIVVFNRNTYNHKFLEMFPTSTKIWWLHDIVDHRYMEDDSYKKIDKIVALSNYCRDCYSDYYGIPQDKFIVIPNGVDKSVFYPGKDHNPNLFVMASATVKGIYPVSFTLHNLKQINPRIDFQIYSSQKLHDKENGEKEKQQLEQLKKEGASIFDPVPQHELADIFRKSRAVLMLGHYPEICSNILLQAQACGTPVISSNIGSASEFIENRKTGLLTKTKPHDLFWWWKDCAQQSAEIMLNDALYKRINYYAPKNISSWDDIGEKWLTLIRERN